MTAEEKLGNLLKEKGLTITTAESCTGGLIANRITNISGSSEYFTTGFIPYSNNAKESLLGVRHHSLKEHGAVSSVVAEEMARGARIASGSDVAVAVTGIAGPTGGTPEKPVGTVFIAVNIGDNTIVHKKYFSGSRIDIKNLTSDAAIDMVIACLEGKLT